MLPDLAGPFYGDLLMGYERWAGEHGQSVIITVTHGNPDPRRSVRDLAGRVDGIVVHGNALDLPTIQGLRKAGVPLVLIAHPPVTGCDSVRSESAASAEQLTTRLLDHGRTNLLFVGDPASSYDVSERYAGFAKALESRGLRGAETRARAADRGGRHAPSPNKLLDGKQKRPDGLVCANDELALAVLTTLARAADVDVPGDIVVTGWDDVMAARYVSPGLTHRAAADGRARPAGRTTTARARDRGTDPRAERRTGDTTRAAGQLRHGTGGCRQVTE